jgi:hypothetical protein
MLRQTLSRIAAYLVRRIIIYLLVAVLAGIAFVALSFAFMGSDFEEQYILRTPLVEPIKTASIESLVERACIDKAYVVVVHYYRFSDPAMAEQDRILGIIGRHFKGARVDVFAVDLDKLPNPPGSRADTGVDVIAVVWNTDETKLVGVNGPQQTSWHDYPRSYSDLREAVDSALVTSRNNVYRHAFPKDAESECASLLKVAVDFHQF